MLDLFLEITCTVSPLLTAHVRSAQKCSIMRGNRISERCSECTSDAHVHNMYVVHQNV